MHASTNATPDLATYDVILVSSSGGKDSQAMLDEVCTLASAAGVLHRVTVLHCALGYVEWPGTSELARTQAEYYGVRFEERHREQGLLLDQVRRRGRWPSSFQLATAHLIRSVALQGNSSHSLSPNSASYTVPQAYSTAWACGPKNPAPGSRRLA
jgi:hypothetical protein